MVIPDGIEHLRHNFRDLFCKLGRNGVSDLMILCRARPREKVVVGEGLKARRLPHGKTAALHRVIMDEVVTILRDVGRDGGRNLMRELHSEAV